MKKILLKFWYGTVKNIYIVLLLLLYVYFTIILAIAVAKMS